MTKTAAVQYFVGIPGVIGADHVETIMRHLYDRDIRRSVDMEYRPEDQRLDFTFTAEDFRDKEMDFVLTMAFMSGMIPSYVCRAVYPSRRSTQIRSYQRDADGRRCCCNAGKHYLDPEPTPEAAQAA
jgi:hypothetical protein